MSSSSGVGLVDYTGGEAFVLSNNYQRAVDLIWEQAGHYDLLDYTPTSRPHDTHSLEVKVRHPGMQVHARLARGN